MTYKGYCQPTDVANLLGRTLTTSQTSEATTLIAATESYIDRETRRAWIVPPITAERYDLRGRTLYLRWRPVTSIQQLQGRSDAVGDTLYTLVSGTDYELLDPNLGEVLVSWGFYGRHRVIFASYTPNLGTVPADITYAATLIVANSLIFTILPDSYGIAQTRFGRLTGLTFRESGAVLTVPPAAAEILAAYRLPVFS